MSHEAILKAVIGMKHSRLRNYIAPGVTSWLIGGEGHGKVRLFTTDRDTREWITPHSHRFDFTCLVLCGSATNIVFGRTFRNDQGDAYAVGKLTAPSGGLGTYGFEPGEKAEYFSESRRTYVEGDTYAMRRHEIHSIQFQKGSAILFFEGPELSQTTEVLEPWSDGRRVPTFVTQPWMFDRMPDPGVTITTVSEQ